MPSCQAEPVAELEIMKKILNSLAGCDWLFNNFKQQYVNSFLKSHSNDDKLIPDVRLSSYCYWRTITIQVSVRIFLQFVPFEYLESQNNKCDLMEKLTHRTMMEIL